MLAADPLGANGHNAPPPTQGEEAVPARVATIGRELQPAAQPDEPTVGDVLAVNAPEIQIPTPRAVGVPRVSHRHSPGVKAGFARPAAPGTQARQAYEIIAQTALF